MRELTVHAMPRKRTTNTTTHICGSVVCFEIKVNRAAHHIDSSKLFVNKRLYHSYPTIEIVD